MSAILFLKRLHGKGIDTETKFTRVLTVEAEEKLWNSRILNLDTPLGLLRAVFFIMEKAFACMVGKNSED